MKGQARAILFFERRDGRVELVTFPDETWGIVRDGRTVCTWERDDLSDCLRTFLVMASRSRDTALDRPGIDPSCAAHPGNATTWDSARFN